MFRSVRRSIVRTAAAGTAVVVAVEVTTHLPSQGRSSAWYHWMADEVGTKLMRTYLDPETAHVVALELAKRGLAPISSPPTFQETSVNLSTTLWGMKFPNIIGLGAGFDKNGEAIPAMLEMGFGFVEIGSVTPMPQLGNPKPRMYRLRDDEGIINRYGFNSLGMEAVKLNLEEYRNGSEELIAENTDEGEGGGGGGKQKKKVKSTTESGLTSFARLFVPYYSYNPSTLVGVNLGKNKVSEDEIGDYEKGVQTLGPYADYLVINVSSPNTPGLRDLQQPDSLELLLKGVLAARNKLGRHVPLLVKLAPDLTEEELKDIANTIMNCSVDDTKVDGLIISNTTNQRPSSLLSSTRREVGGLSGKPLKNQSTECIRFMYAHTEGQLPIIGVGGISSAKDIMEKLKAGASLVEVYSVMAYKGPGVVSRMRKDLALLIKQEGFRSVEDVVGHDHEELYWKRKETLLLGQL